MAPAKNMFKMKLHVLCMLLHTAPFKFALTEDYYEAEELYDASGYYGGYYDSWGEEGYNDWAWGAEYGSDVAPQVSTPRSDSFQSQRPSERRCRSD